MRTFSDRALNIQPTGVRKMFDLAGGDVISFGLGEPDFQPPPVAIEAFHQSLLHGLFPLYGPDVSIAGGDARYYSCLFENQFIPQVEDLEKLVDQNTVAILYNFPSNPTGGTLDTQQRDELLACAQKHDLWLISDEVYDRIVFEGEHVSFMGTGYERVLLVNSFSKTFAMTGWRMGYIISTNREAMQQIIKMQY